MGSASEIDVEMTVEYVAVPTTGCATPLTSSVEYSGSSWSEKVDEKASAGASPKKVSKTTVTFSPVHLRCVALPVDAHHLECLLERRARAHERARCGARER